jgi:hypothetical protein
MGPYAGSRTGFCSPAQQTRLRWQRSPLRRLSASAVNPCTAWLESVCYRSLRARSKPSAVLQESLSTGGWQQRWARLQFAAQFGELTVSTLKQARGLPVGGVIVIDEGSKPSNISTQPNVLGAPLYDGLPRLCVCESRTIALMIS